MTTLDGVDSRATDRDGSDAATAMVLRQLADRLEAGLGRRHGVPAPGAVLDAHIDGFRCILIVDPDGACVLSPREMEIARLVARGLTNRAIATALDISLWTVSTHLRRIFAKLDVGSRAEMTALVCGASGLPSRRVRSRSPEPASLG